MATIVRPSDFNSGQGYEPPLSIEFGIDSATIDDPPAVMGKTVMPPGAKNQSHRHETTDACIYLISGEMRFIFGDPDTDRITQIARAGDFVHIPRGEAHGVENVSDTEPVHLVFCYPGVADKDEARTVMLEDIDVVRGGSS
jgi:uncharacterized RmlC-like cupin family protein